MAVSAPAGMKYKLNPVTGKYRLVPAPAPTHTPVGAAPSAPGTTPPVATTQTGTIAAPTTAAGGDPYRYVMRGGKRVLVRLSHMTPAEKAASAAAPPPAAGAPAPPNVIDPTDDQYLNDVAQAQYDADTARADYQAQLEQMPSLYNQGMTTINNGFDRNSYDSNAELAARGIVQSGEYQHRAVDRELQRTNQTGDLDRQYGSIAQGNLTRHINDLATQQKLATKRALDAAKERYRQRYPASSYIFQNTQG